MAIKGRQQVSTGLEGFEQARESTIVKRLIIALDGKERTGKTTFGLSAPGPIAYFPLDPGREGVIEKVLKHKIVYLPKNKQGRIETFNYRDATNQSEWEEVWEKFSTAYYKCLSSDEVHSIVVDTSTETYELVRLARLGKLSNVLPHHYGPVNAEMRKLIKQVYETDKNLILIHKLRNEYVNDKRTGEMERAGFGDTGYLVQINLSLFHNEENGFTGIIKDCRQNMDIAGFEMVNPTFMDLAIMVYPETSEKDWQ